MPSTKSKTRLKFDAIGVPWEIEVFDKSLAVTVEKKIRQRIEQFDKTYSRFREDSWISALSERPGSYNLPTDAEPLFKLYDELYTVTDGRVTPLIGQNLSEAGYDAQYSFAPRALTSLPAWVDVQHRQDGILHTRQKLQLDFGAAGKGYLVDCISELLQKAGHQSYVVDASGDLVVKQSRPTQQIGLENPNDTEEVIGVAHLSDGALCSSAGNRRRWAEYSHIIDPHTKRSPRHILATWVVASTALLADGLSTALFFASPETLQKQYTFEYAVVTPSKNGTQISASSGFPAEFFR